ncbi:MAG TPA: integrase, partial [Gammaproteobacteria bacterium]
GGNIITLQRVLGHSSLTVTMRYAHLASDHLEEVLKLNPLKSGLFVDNGPSSYRSDEG